MYAIYSVYYCRIYFPFNSFHTNNGNQLTIFMYNGEGPTLLLCVNNKIHLRRCVFKRSNKSLDLPNQSINQLHNCATSGRSRTFDLFDSLWVDVEFYVDFS